jgi:hypothetical protein
MKIVKIVIGTILALWTAGIAIHGVLTLMDFICRPKTTWSSTRGLTEAASIVAATCMFLTFTVWTFQSAFRKNVAEEDGSDHQEEDGKG